MTMLSRLAGTLFAFGDRGGAVGVEQGKEGGHRGKFLLVTPGALLAPNCASLLWVKGIIEAL